MISSNSKMKNLSEKSNSELTSELTKLKYQQAGIGVAGTVVGWLYVAKSGGKFLRYIGYGILGSATFGVIAYFTLGQKALKIKTELNKRGEELK